MYGASGFIGRHLLDGLKREHRIVGMARRSQLRCGAPFHDNISWFQVDIADRESLKTAFEAVHRLRLRSFLISLAAAGLMTGLALMLAFAIGPVAIVGVLVLVLAGVGLEALVVTEREQVEAAIEGGAAAFVAGDLDGTGSSPALFATAALLASTLGRTRRAVALARRVFDQGTSGSGLEAAATAALLVWALVLSIFFETTCPDSN